MVDKLPESTPDLDEDRRRFLAQCGRFAAVTPPAMTVLLSTSLSTDAIARSGGRRRNAGAAQRHDLHERRPRVLIVDDDVRLREFAAQELRIAGFDVLEAALGEDALGLLQQGTPIDALVTAVQLPGLINGWRLAEKARELRPSLAVIYATAYSPSQTPVKGSLFVEQPYRPNQMAMAVRAITGYRGIPVLPVLTASSAP